MSENIIDVDHVSIRFNLANQKVNNLKEYTIKLLKHELMFQEFMALKDVNLHIKPGESWALIGANGCGKSTLLKAITGILKPYEGTIKVRGKIAPMIELGAGFDMELTARENIFLNGAVLGHSEEFMREHFDSIVEFAGIENFLDSPIKNFSSGMKARLGFAVATMVDPDILICDEVLSVGDINFRKKCAARMEQMLSGGTTLLYVSHNMDSVMELCDHAMWLDHGDVIMAGDSQTVCTAYNEAQAAAYKEERHMKAILQQDSNQYDYLVVGAGATGSTFAQQATAIGKRCLVIDRRDHIGGLAYTAGEDDIHVGVYGHHYMHTDSKPTWDYMRKFTEFTGLRYAPYVSRGEEMYPLSLNMNTFISMWGIHSPNEAMAKVAEQIVPNDNPANLEEAILAKFGRDIYERTLKVYFEKKWGRPCSELPVSILNRFPIRFSFNTHIYDDLLQGVPDNGFTAMFENMLDGIDVRLNTEYREFIKNPGVQYDKVIYTGPIDEYYNYCYGPLAWRTIRTEEEDIEIYNYQGNAGIFDVNPDHPEHCTIEYKQFLWKNQPNSIISREYYGEWTPDCGMTPALPVCDAENMARYEQYKALADQEENVIFAGMMGTYKVMSVAQCVERARKLAKSTKQK